ncbi:hypothetical protein PINS_up008477 [Pythium insidiosum]|nr:hypothetical protein PINS_up008477 [Pythium insidiosum]
MIYWHRRFILAYENMLRSLEPRFACITIPYWDYFADFAKRLTGQCTTFEGCSTFLTEFGSSVGPSTTVSINGISATGNCVSAGPLSNFCQSSTLAGTSSCSRCLPRGNWLSTGFPSGFGYASLARILSGSYGYAWFSQNIHYGIHNSIHNAAGSTMATLATSADPIFYNHQYVPCRDYVDFNVMALTDVGVFAAAAQQLTLCTSFTTTVKWVAQ